MADRLCINLCRLLSARLQLSFREFIVESAFRTRAMRIPAARHRSTTPCFGFLICMSDFFARFSVYAELSENDFFDVLRNLRQR